MKKLVVLFLVMFVFSVLPLTGEDLVSKATLERVRQIAISLKGAPQGWKMVVASKMDWQRVQSQVPATNRTATAFTLRSLNLTVLNGDYAASASPWELKWTIAHEAGHLLCDCDSEEKANLIARGLLTHSVSVKSRQ